MRRAIAAALVAVPGTLTILAIALIAILPGCTTPGGEQRAAEQAALSIELAYQATAIAALTAMHSDALNAAQKRCVAVLDNQAYRAVQATRAAYDRRDRMLLEQVASARLAVNALLIRRGC